MARAATAARQARLSRDIRTGAARLAAGDRLQQEGNIRVASLVYARVALSRPTTPVTEEAKQRLDQLTDEARQKLQAIDAKLQGGEPSTDRSPGEIGGSTALSEEQVLAAFEEYEEIADRYQGVPRANREIKSRITQQRRRPEFAAVLKEPKARALWQLGQQHEQEGQVCCAYWVYCEAARLSPAPSADVAEKRLAEIKQDSQLVAAADACRELRRCHVIYDVAKKLAPRRPDRAKELLAQVVELAPEDSEIYRAASQQLRELN